MNEKSCVLVCVTVQKDCGRLIQKGREEAEKAALPLHVLHVSTGKDFLGNPDAAEAMNYLYALAREVNAQMNILYDADPPLAIARYAILHNAGQLILGQDKSGFSARLQSLLPEGIQILFNS